MDITVESTDSAIDTQPSKANTNAFEKSLLNFLAAARLTPS